MSALIAISAADLKSKDNWLPSLHGQFRTYSDSVVKAGGLPFIIPIVENPKALRELYEKCDGVLLSGGGDINPVLYNAMLSPHEEKFSPERDEQELLLLKWVLEDDKPFLGICRGMQLLNVARGGTLMQDISKDRPQAQNHMSSVDKKDFNHLAHVLNIEPESRLAEVLGSMRIGANAFHHQAIDKLGKGLVISARAEDGIIEGVELPGKRFVIGVQSHPEAVTPSESRPWNKLFEAFVEAASA
ncbi:MAG TPA: gamma-glutamyl-gamma-aminobutyrate hydrolase family protein [Candidatus Saccharimonadia bacterium]|nr:gamma-glutamyl-gamma-aminobutyrate hydrolase family protein [Candidatus Saccharimonadia bacterium]